jgi:hypothetical protein
MNLEARFAPDPKRLAEGWERRFVAEATRAAEMAELYRSLGYEVAADPVRPEDVGEECGECRLVAALRFTVIYTRRAPNAGARPPVEGA